MHTADEFINPRWLSYPVSAEEAAQHIELLVSSSAAQFSDPNRSNPTPSWGSQEEIQNVFETDGWSPAQHAGFLGVRLHLGHAYLIAESTREDTRQLPRMIGALTISRLPEWDRLKLKPPQESAHYISDLHVTPEAQGQGVGTRLLLAALEGMENGATIATAMPACNTSGAKWLASRSFEQYREGPGIVCLGGKISYLPASYAFLSSTVGSIRRKISDSQES
jgi:ribosomal protein S18 acetylase RimI-like enzyme